MNQRRRITDQPPKEPSAAKWFWLVYGVILLVSAIMIVLVRGSGA